MKKIQIMKEVLANKIAAGEVIERPLSVIKELVENSIDAGATSIDIDLKQSGLEQIIISDNGDGMSRDDLELCIKRHATSKLYDDKDLFKISTLGFRGEAIPSIFSVSMLEIISSTDGVTAHHLTKVNEEKYEITKTNYNRGTKIIVNNLFYNTPVRYKHLSNAFYELAIIINYVNKVALIKPNIAFTVTNEGNTVVQTYGNGDIVAIIANQYKLEIAKRLIIANGENEHFQVEIYTSHPQDTRSRKSHITIAINDRLVRNYDIENAIIAAYGTFLHTNQYPISLIKISVNYSLVDVNIHPTKQQVKISLIEDLISLIQSTISEKLNEIMYIYEPVVAPSEQLNSKETYQAREIDDQIQNIFKQSPPNSSVTGANQTANIGTNDNQPLANDRTYIQSDNDVNQTESSEQSQPLEINKLYKEQTDNKQINTNQVNNEGQANFTSVDSTNANEENDKSTLDSKQFESFNVKNNEIFLKLDLNDTNRIPELNYIGQFHKTYLLFENPNELFLMDQHAAQERINYEMFVEKFKNKKFDFMSLLLPLVITLTTNEAMLFEKKLDICEQFGFKIEYFGQTTFKVTEIDRWMADRKNILEDIEDIIQQIISGNNKDWADYYEDVAIMMACKKSIKANQAVNHHEATLLLKELNTCINPFTCPHGRPIFVKLTNSQIEKMFMRRV